MADKERGPLLTTFAALFGLLAISNFSKPLTQGASHGQAGFMFFGTKTYGLANAILGPAFGLYLAIYAVGIWKQKKFALYMAWPYAAYVILNLALFVIKNPSGFGGAVFGLIYSTVAIGVSLGSAIALTRRNTDLS